MKIRIIKPATYTETHQPGKILVNHPNERTWLRSGLAVPVVEFAAETGKQRPAMPLRGGRVEGSAVKATP